MEVNVSKTKLDETKTREGVESLLYEARVNPSHDLQAEENLKEKLQAINSQMDLSLLAQESSLPTFVETRFGLSQTGSFCSYQLSHTEANFTPTIGISSIPRLTNSTPTELTYPRFPLSTMDTFVLPDNLDNTEKEFLQKLEVEEMISTSLKLPHGSSPTPSAGKKSVNINLQLQNFTLSVRHNKTMKSLQLISSTQNHSLQGV